MTRDPTPLDRAGQPGPPAWLAGGFGLLLVAGVLAGLAWVAFNFGHTPAYGDTPEYWRLSHTLRVDPYRGIFYPVFLHAAQALASEWSLPVVAVVDVVQLGVAGWAVFSLAAWLLRAAPHARLAATLATLAVLTNPVILHFALSILTDSLATSFTLLFAVHLLRALEPAAAGSARALATAAIAMVLMMLIRAEKAYLAAAILVLLLALIVWRRRTGRAAPAGRWTPLLVLGLAWFAAAGISRAVTEANPARPPLNVTDALFNRVAWPYMERAYPYFPPDLRERITLTEARHFDAHANHVLPFVTKTLARPGGDGDLHTITLVTLRHFPGSLAGRIAFDFAKYCLPNLAFPLESAGVLPESVATSWTRSRLSMFAPRLSAGLLTIGALQFAAALLVIGIRRRHSTAIRPAAGRARITLLVLGGIVVANAGMFTLSFSMDAHIRYALPGYAIIETVVISAALASLIERRTAAPSLP